MVLSWLLMKKPIKRNMDKPKKATTFRIDPDLLRTAQHYAIDHDITVVEMVERGLRLVLGLKENGK
jgi:hypothetical protein